MQTGAVVMLDALGFKGIWSRCPPATVMAKMRELRRSAHMFTGRFDAPDGAPVRIASSFLSDTIVFSVALEATVPDADVVAIAVAAHQTSLVIEKALTEPPALAYRGCITAGSFEIDYPFLLGKAIDEAGELHEQADGAFAWLAPSALAIWQRPGHSMQADQWNMAPYAVPMKGQRAYRTMVVDLFDPGDAANERQALAAAMLRTFDQASRRDLSIEIKRQNTEMFMRERIALALEQEAERLRAALADP